MTKARKYTTVTESGKKYKLNEEDTKFLKERGVK